MAPNREQYVIKKGNQYLVGCPYDDSSYIRYSTSPYDGFRGFRCFDDALHLARIVGGKVMRFNHLTGRTEGGWK